MSGAEKALMMIRWSLRLSKTFRPWWGLGLVRRTHEIMMTREASEEAMLASLVELKAAYPSWSFELRRS